MRSMVLLLLLLLGFQEVTVKAQQVCNVLTGNKELLFWHNTFNSSSPITLVWTSVVNNQLQLAASEVNGGTWGLAWNTAQERIADGFVSTFTFSIAPTSLGEYVGDGFTFIAQNDAIVNLNGGSGPWLGCDGITNSIAVKFDLCADRDTNPCNLQQISVVRNDVIILPPYPPGITLNDGAVHTAVISYQGSAVGANAVLQIQLDSLTPVTVTVGDLATNTFNSRFAYFGFSASTSWDMTSQIDILTWKMEIQPASAIVNEAEQTVVVPKNVSYGSNVTFLIVLRDSCQIPLPTTPADTTANATLQLQQPAGTNPKNYVILVGNLTTYSNGSIMSTFLIPYGTVGTWNLNVFVNGVAADKMPWSGAVVSIVPTPPTNDLPVWALVLLLLFVLFIVVAISYALFRLWRYRQKLKENAEFIEAGKKQAELNKLEDGTVYSINPMIGTMDDLKVRLQKNEEELARLRALGQGGVDQEHLLQQLQSQRDGLLNEMNRLKIEQQQEEVAKMAGGKATTKPTNRKQFGQTTST